MSTIAAVKTSMFVVRHWRSITIGIVLALIILIGLLVGVETSPQRSGDKVDSPFGRADVPPRISQWKGLVYEITKKDGIPEYTDFLLALMYQELGNSQTLDIMQSSESVGLSPDSIQDPVLSVKIGVQYFISLLKQGKKAGVDFATIVQAYNFGTGYISFIASNGGKHTVKLAQEFSLTQSQKNGGHCTDWRAPYCFGDYTYVQKVMKNLVATDMPVGNKDVYPIGRKAFKTIISEAQKYVGWPYVWSGASPDTGFDCSGFTQWTFSKAGIKLPRTAQEQYDDSTKIPPGDAKPGDLVFYTKTYQTDTLITHIGIYLGSGKMFDSDGLGIGIHNINSPYWKAHLAGFGRVS